jgi:LPS-assembly protein
VLYAGKLPIFYLPYVRYNLDGDSNHWTLTPGYRSSHGAFLLGGYHWRASDKVDGVFHLDYRTKRGFAGGPDVNYDAGRWGDGEFRFYYLYDTDPDSTSTTSTNASISHNRNRLYFTHGVTVRTNLDARVVLRQQSDAYVTRDFLESEYRDNPQPSSFLEANQRWPNFTLVSLPRPRSTISRIPSSASRPEASRPPPAVGRIPALLRRGKLLGYYRQNYQDDSPTNDYSAFRADTYQEVLLPLNLFGWLNLAPRVGGRFTHYGETDGEGSTLTEQDRWVFNTGAELSFKASRVWHEPQSKLLEIDGLRHIIQPAFNYVYVPEPSVRPPELPQFDTDLPSLRLLPNDFPTTTTSIPLTPATSSASASATRLQTKRDGEVDNLVNWSLYTDWRLDRLEGQSTFSDLFSDLDLETAFLADPHLRTALWRG